MKPILVATLCVLLLSGCRAQNAPAQFAVEKMTAFGGVISVTSDDGKTWRHVSRGSDPALSPNGRLLAYTWYSRNGTSHERYIRIVDLETGNQTEPNNWHESVQQYGAEWSNDSNIVYFNIFIFAKESSAWTWSTGKLSYPDIHFERVHSGRPASLERRVSPNGEYRLTTEIVSSDPPLAHDMPSAIFIEHLQTKSKIRVTPNNMWIPSGAQWISDEEIVFPGLWHDDYGKTNGKTLIYRINLKERDWSISSKADFDTARFAEGFQVSVARNK